jgi:hypothetical protein
MSSSNVVFAMCYCIPYHTENKPLVPELPTFTDVYSFTVSYTITIELFKGLKKMDTPGNLVDSPTHRYGESFFEYEYLREFEAKIGTALNVV